MDENQSKTNGNVGCAAEPPRYIGVKIINARPMDSHEYANAKGKPYDPTSDAANGYLVFYQDGYRYWSPKGVFEEAYRRTDDITVGLAIEAAKKGFKIARRKWNGKNMFVVYMPPMYLPPFNTQDTNKKVNDRTAKYIGEDKPLDCQPYFAMYNAQGQWIPGWSASQSDMLDDDWYIVV